MKKTYFILVLILLAGGLFAAAPWDMLDKSMSAWNTDGGDATNRAWRELKGRNITTVVVKQETGYANITKTAASQSYNYAFLVSNAFSPQQNTAYSFEIKARVNAINKTQYPDASNAFEAHQLSAVINGKYMAIYLKHGDENSGYISLTAAATHAEEDKYRLNTADWHVYRFVFHADNSKFDVYINDIEDPIFENAATISKSGENNVLRIGAESTHRCNIDIEYGRVGTGDLYSKPKIASVVLSSDSHVEGSARTIAITTNTTLIDNGEKLLFSLVDGEGNTVVEAVEATVSQAKAVANFTIPAALAKGKYFVKAAASDGKIGDVEITPKKADYMIVEPSPITSNLLPNVVPMGFIKNINDYQYIGPSKEFIFPSILDTKPHTENGKFLNGETPLDRYYCFYAPHENPGGMYLATGPTLDGPWTERNTVMNLAWAKAVPNNIVNTADHISACHVMWNDVYNKYFMYFHGPNTTTYYAVSDNLIDWTFGADILTAQSFGSRGNEASYARVFEHKLPEIDNKYILMLMIAESSTSRKIYWAHSKDGIDWTCSRKPLISPDLNYKKIPGTDIKPNYSGGMGNNVSGPFFMKSGNRYFVFYHSSAGHICVAEVGESFDMEVHWGEYMKASEAVIDTDANGVPRAVSRVASPQFIQNDAGKWYLFIEAGSRLGANTGYAKEPDASAKQKINQEASPVAISNTMLNAGQTLLIQSAETNAALSEVMLYSLTGNKVYSSPASDYKHAIQAPAASGMYMLSVKLNNNTSKEFKILVK